MVTFIRTDANNADFIKLVKQLDSELSIRDGEEHKFYAQLNKTDFIRHVMVAYENNVPVGCGALKQYSSDTMEIKRMFVPLTCRNKGIASQVLQQLEMWAKEMNYSTCILETGKKQPEAIALYTKNNYIIMPNFGKYEGIENSVCFQKTL